MISKEEFKKLSSKQDELRKIRNMYANKQRDIQKEINDIEIRKYDVDKFIGKIIVIKDYIGDDYRTYEFMVVDGVERLYRGPKFHGKILSFVYSDNPDIGNSLQFYEHSEYNSNWYGINSILTVEPEKVKKQINNMFNVFDYGEELNKLMTKHE